MLKFHRSNDLTVQKEQLLFLGMALLAVAAIGVALYGFTPFPFAFAIAGILILTIAILFSNAVPPVYTLLTILAFLIGRVVSHVITILVYILGVAFAGAVLKLAGMDKLQKSHSVNCQRPTMFIPAPSRSSNDLERQS